MSNRQELAKRFEKVCERLFESLGEVEPPRSSADKGYDFWIHGEDGDSLVEVKLYKSRYVPTPWLWSAAERLQRLCQKFRGPSGILAVTCRVTEYTRGKISAQSPSVLVYDPYDLSRLGRGTAAESDLQAIVREAQGDSPVRGGNLLASPPLSGLEPAPFDLLDAVVPGRPLEPGKTICDDLRALTPGMAGFRDFERVGEKAIRYLFSDEFSKFIPQQVGDDLQRIDLIGKLAPVTDFWKGIAHDFRTRFVVFEFKNYADPITPNEIYGTEKYLFTDALRSVAIVMSRKGASRSARDAAKGALRETGKLIVVLSLDEICNMLSLKDNNEDPSDIINDAVDEMLATITR